MNYNWTYAHLPDAEALVNLSVKYQYEVDPIFTIDANVFAHNITSAIINQYYTGYSDLVAVARDTNNNLLGYTWAKGGEKGMWSRETIVNVRIAHVDPDLSVRCRILLVKDMLSIWEQFAKITNCSVIASSSIRQEQTAFMRLHEQAGYLVRGGVGYKRVDLSNTATTLFEPDTSHACQSVDAQPRKR